MIRFRGLATAGLAVALLASTAGAAVAADGTADQKDPLDAAISAYQRVYPKISLDAATRAASQQDARKSLYESIGTDKSFGGAYFDPPTGILHIAATDKATAQRAVELGKAQDLQVEPQLVKRSYEELLGIADSLRRGDTELGKATRGQIGIEVQSNQVIAAVPASQVEALAKSAPDGVSVVADPGVKTEADQCTSRAFCDTTIHAGNMLWTGARGNNVCSVGFTARDALNQRFTYTAGHCSGGNGVTWGTGNQVIGPMQSSVNFSFLDASIIRVTNSWFTGDRGGEIYNEFFPNRTVNVNGVAPSLGFIWVGDVTCLSANFTQPNGFNFCGVIGSTMDFSVRGMVRVNGLDACPGDSGGGWYWLTNSGRRYAYGLHSRSDDGCHGSNGGSHSWFSALPLVKAFFTPGLNVETRP